VPEQATRTAQRATWLGVLVLLGALSVGRLLFTTFSYGVPAWFDEELNPLIGLITRGQPISQIDPRQYGVVVFLVFDPALRVVGDNLAALAVYAAWIALVSAYCCWSWPGRAPYPCCTSWLNTWSMPGSCFS